MSFYDTVLRNSKAFRSDVVCKDMALLEPGTRAAVQLLLDDCTTQGIDLRLLETYRSQTRQSALFVKGATQLRTVGCHGYGVAADFGLFIGGKYQTQGGPYEFLRRLARKHGLISGLDWGRAKGGSWDSGHVQRVPIWRQSALFSGSWYPPADYDPYADSAKNGHSEVVMLDGAAPVKPTEPAAPPTLRIGSKGADVSNLQRLLKIAVDGDFGPATAAALKRFQAGAGLTADGVCGPRTWAAIVPVPALV
jgi:putative peptidoglycan binding protein